MRHPVLGSLVAFTAAAAVVVAVPVRADTPPRSSAIRAIADAYSADGDLDHARSELAGLAAKPDELLAELRAVPRPTAELVGGTRTLDLTDGEGRKTQVILIAPSTEQLRARTTPLPLICVLHGLGGSARGAIPFCEHIVASGELACVAPTALKIGAKENSSDDGMPEIVHSQFKNWWSYDSPRSFTLEAIRKAQEQLWVDPDRIALAGVSMGGYGTWNIGLRRPDHFAALVPLAGGISFLGAISDKDPVSLALLENGRPTPVWSAHGAKDPLVPPGPDKEACERLAAIGGTATYHSLDVGHTPEALKKAFEEGPLPDEIQSFVLTARRKTSPEEVTYVSLSEKLDGAHWLRIVERSPQAKWPKVHGRVDRAENRVTVELTGVRRARVFLDERLLDAMREVEVVSGGRVVWRGKIASSIESILESWRSRRDPGLVYAAYVDVGPTFR
jgi:predicted esterase